MTSVCVSVCHRSSCKMLMQVRISQSRYHASLMRLNVSLRHGRSARRPIRSLLAPRMSFVPKQTAELPFATPELVERCPMCAVRVVHVYVQYRQALMCPRLRTLQCQLQPCISSIKTCHLPSTYIFRVAAGNVATIPSSSFVNLTWHPNLDLRAGQPATSRAISVAVWTYVSSRPKARSSISFSSSSGSGKRS